MCSEQNQCTTTTPTTKISLRSKVEIFLPRTEQISLHITTIATTTYDSPCLETPKLALRQRRAIRRGLAEFALAERP
ncbi:hypothetical protein TPAR_02882 [Tolypocladium paradoxum]|uniref:Uncharacterized protein n=1 Tax=Tolypocladium paradoxum TaxID=94208 RepID=A0A2S4L3A3_9HYPO|nr:hypothetical protein TPAR_02882 [Tolypocladium paradoxum]